MMSRFAAIMYAFAGFSGLVVVAFEALAAHGLAGFAPTGEQAVVWFNQATSFQMTQTFALILATAIAERLAEGLGRRLMRKAAVLFLLAAVLFPGGLYSGSFNGPLITAPFGGIAAMAGWVLFGVSAWFGYRDANREEA
jgi:uncharacterized membrane protein YgdD (TMEM256/DUF423 family)